MSDLTLYYAKGTCAFVPQSLILHLRLSAKFVEMKDSGNGFASVDGSMSNIAYKKIHPQGYVPALRVGNEIITEVAAILVYIGSLAKGQSMVAQGDMEQARLMEWLVYFADTVHGAFAMIYRPRRYVDNPDFHESVIRKGKKGVEACFTDLEPRLKGKDFPFGERLTIVDFFLYIFGRWALDCGYNLEKDYPYQFKHFQRLEKLTGIQQATEIHKA
ncbi:glutathione S-transferase [Ilyonectria robusta]|uniref:glutathione S-transferase n=1 Tax=Ilyonectria robusta TaxID=1079257 RepID=UPI001E8CD045|nr:glutathione S-transferase [Ilyonectria robusta]KAH8680399.1 glutathione S-transferase [Ilyonectria robusta]